SADGPTTNTVAAAGGQRASAADTPTGDEPLMTGHGSNDAIEPIESDSNRPDARLVSATKSSDSLRTVLLPEGTVNRLKPGELDGIETGRAESGRAVVELPLEGLVIQVRQIHFDGIDFVWPPAGRE